MPEVRLLTEDGKTIAIMPFEKALAAARAEDKDLVEIAAEAQPPACKLLDYKKVRVCMHVVTGVVWWWRRRWWQWCCCERMNQSG